MSFSRSGRLLVLGVAIGLLVLVIWGVRRQERKRIDRESPQNSTEGRKHQEQMASAPRAESEDRTGQNAKSFGSEASDSAKMQGMMRRLENLQVVMRFYGRVVDENNVPVPDAAVHVRYSYFDPLRPELTFGGTKELTFTTDARGEFSLPPMRGYGVDVKVEKGGYYTSPLNKHSFLYVNHPSGGNFQANPADPIIFRLMKKGSPSPLLVRRDEFALPSDGTAVEIDMLNGATNGRNADLVVRYWGNNSQKDEHGRFDWRVRIEATMGGVLENKEAFDFIAPASGYQALCEIVYRATATNWTDFLSRKKMFVRLRNGEVYGNVNFTIAAGRGTGAHLYLDSSLNPSGSRNLEPDPKLLFPNLDAYHRYMAEQKQTSAKP